MKDMKISNNLKNERYIYFKYVLNNNNKIQRKKVGEKSVKIALKFNFEK